ncbi:MAG: hypothetical protein WCG98_09830, partial [bacterium]
MHFGSTYTTVISNLLNIGAGVIQPNQAGTFSVSPTQNTIYSFTAKGTGACFTTPSTCTGTVTVLPTVPPVLQISKTLLINKAYHSGDLVGFRIDFKNIGSGVA